MDDLFKPLGIEKGEWLEEIEHRNNSLTSFLACVVESMSKKERRFEERLNIILKIN